MIEEIKQRMKQLGVTQTKLARRLGWTQSLISQYLGGHKQPSHERVEQMVAALGGRLKITWPKSGR
jgi:transcriptional regulator with XRE-family HTH domain